MKGSQMHLSDQLKDQRGFTLLEVIIVIAIMGFVLMGAFSFMHFGNRAFQATSKHVEEQFEVRMPLDFITDSVKFAEEVQVLNALPADTNYNYIYLNASKQIVYKEKNSSVETPLPGISGVSDYTFAVVKKSNQILGIKVGKAGSTTYDITTEISVLNVGSSGITGSTGYCIRFSGDPVITGLPPEIASVNPISVTVPQNCIYPMPSRVDVTFDDSSTGKADVTWDSTINTTSVGVKTSEGDVDGFTGGKAQLSVTVVNSMTPSIVDPMIVEVALNEAYALPNAVPVEMSDGETYNMLITWAPDTVDTSVAGDKPVVGTLNGYGVTVDLTVRVTTTTPVTIVSIKDIEETVNVGAGGGTFIIPVDVSAEMSDGTTNDDDFSAKWDPTSFSTGTAGIYTAEGTVDGYSSKVIYTLKVIKSKLPSPGSVSRSKSGNIYTISLKGMPGATVYFVEGSSSNVGIIPPNGEFAITGTVKNEYKDVTSVYLTHNDWDKSDNVNVP